MEEIWKTIDDYPNYEISNLGNVKNKKTGCLLKPLERKGYFYVDLYNTPQKPMHKPIHRLVAVTFLGSKENKVVNHIDGNRYNNRLDNLEWVTPEENSTLASKNGLYKTKPVKINETGKIFKSIKDCSLYLKCDPADICHVLGGKRKQVKGYTFSYVTRNKSSYSNFLDSYQLEAVSKMKDGCILNGEVGSGKSRTGLYYYFKENGGTISATKYLPMDNPLDLYIITTAKKRDSSDWEKELNIFGLSSENYILYGNLIIIDSWNNIQKYTEIKNAFFIFDEDRVTGNGAWVKAFYKITKNNRWIILSATAGDTWMDYGPVFVANGFYKNISDFKHQHIIYNPHVTKYPMIDRYINTNKLEKLRRQILVPMQDQRHTTRNDIRCVVDYDKEKYKRVWRDRWDIYDNCPIEETGKLFYLMRRVVNSDPSRIEKLRELILEHPKIIIFYNFTYELEQMRIALESWNVPYSEWNGQKHEEIITGDRWAYLVQYTAGAEGWNCIETDTIIFYSQTYSYRARQQAAGRIDRMNTPFKDLYYFHFISYSPIDLAIQKSLKSKKSFNERKFLSGSPDYKRLPSPAQ